MSRRPPAAAIVVLALIPTGLIALKIWQQREALHGPSGGSAVIEGTEIALGARLAARVARVPVVEGQSVKAGEVLVELDCADTEAMLAEARARLEAARAQAAAAAATASAADAAAKVAKAASEASAAQAAGVAAQRDAASRQAGRLQQQGQDVAAAALDQSQTTAAALEQQAAAASASARASRLQASAAGGQGEAASANASAAAAAVAAGEAAVARAELLVAECVVRAPRDAVVQTLPWEPGELVPLGMPLVRLVDLAEVTATFYLPNAELGAVHTGAVAEVVADAWPDRVFQGSVRTIASQAEFTPRNIQTRTDRDRLVFPVEVAIPNPDHQLHPGMPVQITLPGTER